MSRKGPWMKGGGGFQKQKEKPLFTVKNSSTDGLNQQEADTSFSVDREAGSFAAGWKLYFPFKSFKDSPDLVSKIKAMEKHLNLKDLMHWYDRSEIEERCILPLHLDILRGDPNFIDEWPSIIEDLYCKSTQTLSCMSLAMHNVIVKSNAEFQYKKIYARPISGLKAPVKLSEAHQTNGELISIIGTVVRIEAVKVSFKTVCFRCATCSSELAVKQNATTTGYVYPSSCHKGCAARSGFKELLSSSFTVCQPKQIIHIQESIYAENQEFKRLEVELIQDLVESVILGSIVTVTGVKKHRTAKNNQKFVKKEEAKFFKSYLKCFSLEVEVDLPSSAAMSVDEHEIIQLTKAQPSPFRLLVHSLCSTIYGREEAKAGLVLALLSGSNITKKFRSESHVLLIGNPGAGKSKLLQACAQVSAKGIFVSGPTSTAVGLTATVGKNGNMEAGSLILANKGVCCIDEFDKMSSHAHVLLESMESQIVSITKCGARVNLASNVVIIAAANPTGSFYDRTKTVSENVKISAPLMSRFDLIYRLVDQGKSSDEAFMNHLSKSKNPVSQSFFSTARSLNKEQISWLKLQPGENIDIMPTQFLQLYIGNAREKVIPTMSDEARNLIRGFFLKLHEITTGVESINITLRHLESMIRLTLARARADWADEATAEHARDVINIFKFTMVDIFADEESNLGDEESFKKPKSQNCSSLSKPKQLKAFIDHLRDLEKEEFASGELKNIAKELGIRDYYEIIDKLNHAGELLKTVDGYRVVD